MKKRYQVILNNVPTDKLVHLLKLAEQWNLTCDASTTATLGHDAKTKRLTGADLHAIWSSTETAADLAERYGKSKSYIANILSQIRCEHGTAWTAYRKWLNSQS